jgi:excisionase family DNA binding protein
MFSNVLGGHPMAHCAVPGIPLTERRTYTMGEVAALLGMSVATLYAERARGRLRTIRLAGRRLITREALDAYVATARRDMGQSDMGPEAERLLDNEQQSRLASTLPVAPASPRHINRGNRETNKAGPLPTGTGLQFCSPRSRKNNQHDDT